MKMNTHPLWGTNGPVPESVVTDTYRLSPGFNKDETKVSLGFKCLRTPAQG
jgi:hypothetical protein